MLLRPIVPCTVLGSATLHGIPVDLADAITELIVTQPDQSARAQVVRRLLDEVYQSVTWLHATEPDHPEMSLLLRVIDAADVHLGDPGPRTEVLPSGSRPAEESQR